MIDIPCQFDRIGQRDSVRCRNGYLSPKRAISKTILRQSSGEAGQEGGGADESRCVMNHDESKGVSF